MLRVLQVSGWEPVSKVVQFNLQSTSPHSRQPCLIVNFMSNHTDRLYWLVGRGKEKLTTFAAFIKIILGQGFGLYPSSYSEKVSSSSWLKSADTKQQQSGKQWVVPTQSSKRPFFQSGLLLHFWVFTQLRDHTDCLRQWAVKSLQVQKRHQAPSIIIISLSSTCP